MIIIARIFLNLLNQAVVDVEGKIIPFTSVEQRGNPSVWWADSQEEFDSVMGIFKAHPEAEIFID